ncbi:hypothetical protein [Burkholderia gladioli]|uniref:hypothetical protein n=1 Tax=Burkholderia gladioli TaxID=28095 RepID=UPI00164120D1|nr:hypothetical protein [Burkholderia gladioli]
MAEKKASRSSQVVQKTAANPQAFEQLAAITASSTPGNVEASTIALRDLDLDEKNPRFGRRAGHVGAQSDSLDYIVENFGVDNLLSSLAINGYFDAEPLIVRPAGDRFVVVEGNRRLAACLILSGDERAKNQFSRTQAWRARTKGEWTSDTKVPVRIFTDAEAEDSLLPYLGVRHLVASQPWDSYAKAKWIADVVESGKMSLEEIVEVIGDKNNTVERLLEGYYFVNQVTEAGAYDTKQSVRRGRGSNPEYPFSWVYTLLDNGGVRNWLGIGERKATNRKVLAADRIDDGASTLRYLLGDKKQGRNPAITDSREIGLLGAALGDSEKRSQLRMGKSAREIDFLSKRADELYADFLNQALSFLVEADGLFSTGRLAKEDAVAQISKLSQLKTVVDGLIQKSI